MKLYLVKWKPGVLEECCDVLRSCIIAAKNPDEAKNIAMRATPSKIVNKYGEIVECDYSLFRMWGDQIPKYEDLEVIEIAIESETIVSLDFI